MKISTFLTIRYDFYRILLGLKPKHNADPRDHEDLFFSHGWGDEKVLEIFQNHELLSDEPAKLNIEWKDSKIEGGHRCSTGTFESPFFADLLPKESRAASVKMFLPTKHDFNTPLCIIFSMTGDEGFSHRSKHVALPLLKKGIGTLLLENPFYGSRRSKNQMGYVQQQVQDMLLMNATAVQEGRALLKYFKNKGYKKLGVAGISQGAMIAAITAVKTDIPLAIACSLPAHAPDVILAEGLLSCFVDWVNLGEKTKGNVAERLRKVFEIGDISKLPPPKLTKAAFILGAKRDLVAPQYSVKKVHEAWPGSHLKWLPGTHMSSLAFHSRAFRHLVMDSFSELNKSTLE